MDDEKRSSEERLSSYKEGLKGNDEETFFSERSKENEEGLKDKALTEKQNESKDSDDSDNDD